MNRPYLLAIAVLMATAPLASGETLDETHLLENFLIDATVNDALYGEPVFVFASSDPANLVGLGGRLSAPLSERFQLGGEWGFASISPDQGDGESGITDLRVSGRYGLDTDGDTQVAVGGFLTLPVGAEEIGQGRTDFGGFAAMRHPLSDELVIAASGGLYLVEIGDDREASLALGGGLVIDATRELDWLVELTIETERDIALLSGGVDYTLDGGGRLRGQLGIGIGDGSPDIQLRFGYLFGH